MQHDLPAGGADFSRRFCWSYIIVETETLTGSAADYQYGTNLYRKDGSLHASFSSRQLNLQHRPLSLYSTVISLKLLGLMFCSIQLLSEVRLPPPLLQQLQENLINTWKANVCKMKSNKICISASWPSFVLKIRSSVHKDRSWVGTSCSLKAICWWMDSSWRWRSGAA